MAWNGQKSLETHQIILFRELLSVFYCQASFPIILEMPRSGFFPPPCPKLTLTETLPWGEFITRAMRLLLSVQTHPPSFPLILCNVNKSSVGLGGYWKARNAAHVFQIRHSQKKPCLGAEEGNCQWWRRKVEGCKWAFSWACPRG